MFRLIDMLHIEWKISIDLYYSYCIMQYPILIPLYASSLQTIEKYYFHSDIQKMILFGAEISGKI